MGNRRYRRLDGTVVDFDVIHVYDQLATHGSSLPSEPVESGVRLPTRCPTLELIVTLSHGVPQRDPLTDGPAVEGDSRTARNQVTS